MTQSNYKIETVYTLLQPLSHGGMIESNGLFLNTIRVLKKGKVQEVFAYSGNALRGGWRDRGAQYLLETLEIKVPKKSFHILFSGGTLEKGAAIDIEQSRRLREMIPLVSVLGASIGNQMLSGKLSQTFAYPVCSESEDIVPKNVPDIDYSAQDLKFRKMTGTATFTRRDDMSTARLLSKFLDAPNAAKGETTLNMLYDLEYAVPNTQLWHQMTLSCNLVELGAFVSCLYKWAENPILGGKAASGFGRVDARFMLRDGDAYEAFITVKDGKTQLSALAQEAKDAYDAKLEQLKENPNQIINVLEGKK